MLEFSARFRICDPIFEPHSDALLGGVDGRQLGPVTGQRCSQAKVIRSMFRSQPVMRGKLTQPPWVQSSSICEMKIYSFFGGGWGGEGVGRWGVGGWGGDMGSSDVS